jgi:hypothetical protein
MSTSLPSGSQPQKVDPSVELPDSAPTTFQNGTAPLTAIRFAQLLTRENIGWTLVALVAMDYFQITNQAFGLVSNVC